MCGEEEGWGYNESPTTQQNKVLHYRQDRRRREWQVRPRAWQEWEQVWGTTEPVVSRWHRQPSSFFPRELSDDKNYTNGVLKIFSIYQSLLVVKAKPFVHRDAATYTITDARASRHRSVVADYLCRTLLATIYNRPPPRPPCHAYAASRHGDARSARWRVARARRRRGRTNGAHTLNSLRRCYAAARAAVLFS